MRKKRRYVLISVAILLAIGVATRIMWNNAGQHNVVVETYQMGDEVALEDNYFLEEYEIAKDYVITVNSAEILSCEEFLEKYNDGAEDIETLFPTKDMTYPEMVCDINVTVKNIGVEESEDIGINLANYELLATDYKLQISDPLYQVANPQMPDGTQMFRLKPQTEMSFHIPYYFSVSAPYSYLTVDEVKNSDLYLVLSIYPVEKRILVSPISEG